MVLEKLWTDNEINDLKEMCVQGRSLEEMAQHFDRSPDGVRLKMHRLGLVISLETLCSTTTSTTTSDEAAKSAEQRQSTQCPNPNVAITSTLEPIKPAEKLISIEDAAKMTLGCIQRLNEKGLTALDLKRIRLIIPALKDYIVLQTDYVEKLEKVERHVEELNKVVLAQLEDKIAKAQTDQERKNWEEQVLALKEKT
ncbi:MAG TPA: hypothetical protein VLV84_02305 [Candidatus Acidoferrales bacterium]|nr:hypothetical protein [Candidatus Acidoferrales bacterium]